MEEPKYSKGLQKHIVKCPHCGADALDHMTKCPKCGEQLVPKGYTPILDEKIKKRIKAVLWIVLSVIAIALVLWRVL